MSSWEHLLFDLECDGFRPKRIWCLSMVDLVSHEKESFVGESRIAEAIMRIQAAKMVAGHNIKSFDLGVIERITQGLVQIDRSKVLDTLYLSKALVKMTNHRLEDWGEILEFPKMETPFSLYRFDERMSRYCENDVDLNHRVLLALIEIMKARHGEKIPKKWEILREYHRAREVKETGGEAPPASL